jgi:hypothetical protein
VLYLVSSGVAGAASNFYWDSVGNEVGIGTAAPSAPLHIEKASTGNSPITSQLYIYNPTNTAGQCSIVGNRIAGSTASNVYYSLDVAGFYGFSIGMVGSSSRLQFRNAWNFGGTEVMTLLNAGNVGINSTTPNTTFDVVGNVYINSGVFNGPGVGTYTAGNGTRIIIWPGSATVAPFSIGVESGAIWYALPGAHRFYGSSAGTTFLGGFNNILTGGATTISVDASGYIVRGATSDVRLKSNVAPMTNYGLETIKQLNPIYFEWNEDAKKKFGEGTYIGLVAQDVQSVFPNAVSKTNDDIGTLTIDYATLIPVLINSIKELSNNNIHLETRLVSLETKI